jgi:hypothetical protein
LRARSKSQPPPDWQNWITSQIFFPKISKSERRDGLTTSQVGPIPSGNLFGPFGRELDCARGGLKIKKRSYNSVDAFHRGIQGIPMKTIPFLV